MTSLAEHAAALPYHEWVGDIPQRSAQETILRLIELLDVHPGHRVLEIGAGTGWSGALLARLARDGQVVSLDVDQDLVDRARARHEDAGHGNIAVHYGDGRLGWPPGGPYDRIIAWCTPLLLPATWLQQAADTAVVVTPVRLADVAAAHAVVRVDVERGIPHPRDLHTGSFVEMTSSTPADFAVPAHDVDAVREGTWVSAHQLHGRPTTARILASLLSSAEPQYGFLPAEQQRDFAAWLLAHTDNPCTAGGPCGRGCGVAYPDSLAIVLSSGALIAVGDLPARVELASHLDSWLAAGQPPTTALHPRLLPRSDGYLVRVGDVS